MKRFVLGDIHGEYDSLLEVIEKSGINKDKDLLIQIGDIIDRGSEPFKCMDKLLEFKNLVLIMGNHDQSFIHYIHNGFDMLGEHHYNGTAITKEKWNQLGIGEKKHYQLTIFDRMRYYYVTEDNILFVHGGFNRNKLIKDQEITTYTWDRELVQQSMSTSKGQKLKTIENFKEIFIGHTPTIYWNKLEPIYRGGIMNVDTGSGKGGVLTIMNIDTHEYWQSTLKKDLLNHGIYKKIESSKTEETEEGESEKDIKTAA